MTLTPCFKVIPFHLLRLSAASPPLCILTGSCLGVGLGGAGVFDTDQLRLSQDCNDTTITSKNPAAAVLLSTGGTQSELGVTSRVVGFFFLAMVKNLTANLDTSCAL